ncbi:HIT domain-containing protein [Holosporaceae bacterium 'Namur']|nr:HIT domain-containing protein [Holosporaceae bacterium 'Namur']
MKVKKYDSNNIFARIIRNEIACNKIYEDDTIIAFHDLNPAAPLHILVIPKGEYTSYDDFILKASEQEIAHFFKTVRTLTHNFNLTESGYRLITNHGSDGMQTIPHFHLHILGKTKLGALVADDQYHKDS